MVPRRRGMARPPRLTDRNPPQADGLEPERLGGFLTGLNQNGEPHYFRRSDAANSLTANTFSVILAAHTRSRIAYAKILPLSPLSEQAASSLARPHARNLPPLVQ